MAQHEDRNYRRNRDDNYRSGRDDNDTRQGRRGMQGGEYGWDQRSPDYEDWNQDSSRMGRGGEQGGWQSGSERRYDADRGYGGSGYSGGPDQDYSRSNYGPGSSYGGWGNTYGRRDMSGGSESSGTQGGRGFMDKASDEVSSWFGDEGARRRRERDEHRGRGPKGYARSDDRIKEDVNDRLTDEGSLDASDIEVQVSSREVTLSGEVHSREDKRRAEDIAEMVSGVSHVQNNLRVKNRTGAMTGSTTATSQSATGSAATGKSTNQRS
jgi:osmotically-inducible protein OsmY